MRGIKDKYRKAYKRVERSFCDKHITQKSKSKGEKMYYCEKCKRFVNGADWECASPNHKMGEVEEASNSPFYREVRCEICGSDDLEEAYKCEYCGEPTLDTYCDWCMDEATAVVRFFIKGHENRAEARVGLLEEACNKVWLEIQHEKEKE